MAVRPMGTKRDDGRHLPTDLAVTQTPVDAQLDAANVDDVELDEKLGAALERVGHALRVLLWKQAKEHNLSPTQVQLMLRLAHEPAGRRRIGALAAEFDVTTPTISDAIAVLRRKGLLASSAVEGDRRAQVLTLSNRGRDVTKALSAWQQPVVDHLAHVRRTDKDNALALLIDLLAALRNSGVIGVARVCPTCRFFRRDAHTGPTPHHCALLDSPLALSDLRVDCREHQLQA